jgi:transposase-like protein
VYPPQRHHISKRFLLSSFVKKIGMMLREKKAEMFASVAQWKRSSMTKGAYAQSVGISKSKFEYWVRKVRETGLSSDDFPKFVEIRQQSRASPLPEVETRSENMPLPQMALSFPGGLCLKIYG